MRTEVGFNITGRGIDNPVVGVSFNGIEFRDFAYTYISDETPQGMPSGGDWAMARAGVLRLDTTEDTLIANCSFTRNDGNAVSINFYTRSLRVIHNDFSFLGEVRFLQFFNHIRTSLH